MPVGAREDSAPTPVLRTCALSRHFGGVTAVDAVDFAVEEGERHAVIGPNGAGKSTLFKLIAGEYEPSNGTIELFGRDISRMSMRRRARLQLARTFQTPSVFDGLSVERHLQLALLGVGRGHLSMRPMSARIRTEAVEAAERFGLADLLHVEADSLSHGERRQVEIAMSLVTSPRLLMLDEPGAGLAADERGHLVRRLRALPADMTLVIIEHDMNIALGVSDRVTMMHDGRVVAEGTPEEIRADPIVHQLYLGQGFAARERS